MRVSLLILIMIFGLASPTIAGYYDGNRLHSACEDEDYFSQGVCLGYIVGSVAMLADLQSADVFRPFFKADCVPTEQVQTGQIRDVVKKYLREHPEERHFLGSVLVITALREAFPCK